MATTTTKSAAKKSTAKPAKSVAFKLPKWPFIVAGIVTSVALVVAIIFFCLWRFGGKKTEEAAKQPAPTTTVEEKTESSAQPAPSEPTPSDVPTSATASIESQALTEAGRAEGGSSVYLPEANIAYRSGPAATTYEEGEADKKRYDGMLALEKARIQKAKEIRAMELKAELDSAEAERAMQVAEEEIQELTSKIENMEVDAQNREAVGDRDMFNVLNREIQGMKRSLNTLLQRQQIQGSPGPIQTPAPVEQ